MTEKVRSMRTTVKRALLVGALTAGLAVPTGVAIAASGTPTPTPGTGTTQQAPGYGYGPGPGNGAGMMGRGPQSGPPSWAPQECQEHFNDPAVQKLREEHRAEMQKARGDWDQMQKLREEHRAEMQKLLTDS